MKKVYHRMEKVFEKFTSLAIAIMGNSITFVLAFITVFIWLTESQFYKEDIHYRIGDIILGLTFLSLFLIQKSFNRFAASLHLKVNELVSSHEPANNTVIDLEQKTEREISELSKEYSALLDKE